MRAIRRFRIAAVVLPVVLALMGLNGADLASARNANSVGASYVVVLKDGASMDQVIRRFEPGLTIRHRYHKVFNGFAADLDDTARTWFEADPDVVSVAADQSFRMTAVTPRAIVGPSPQVPTAAVTRVGGLKSPTAGIDGRGGKVDADIAIIDSGVDRDHPDLNVAGGVNCTGGSKKAWDDESGHGTFVAGVAAARDNKVGVVGVAPGARVWAVKVTDASDTFTMASLICGLEWILNHRPTIDVVNMSFENPHALGQCPKPAGDPVHLGVCKLVGQGTTVVGSAGNSGVNATGLALASYTEVITVSAFTDTDGKPGGKGKPPTCLPTGFTEKDDTFAFFSNFGPTVDITAPGVCVGSTFLDGQYSDGGSGTSYSAPLVTGAAALVRAKHPTWSPARVRTAILAAATPGPIRQDPDGFPEPVLDVSRF